MVIIYKGKGILVFFSLIVSLLTLMLVQPTLIESNQYFLSLALLISGIYNFMFTLLFLKKDERQLSEEKFQAILLNRKLKFPNRKFNTFTIKMMRIIWNPKSSFFFIDNATWTYIYVIASMVVFVLNQ
ncbi:hypothetical protein ACYSNO_00745 [Enterococcus sp. LJL98]